MGVSCEAQDVAPRPARLEELQLHWDRRSRLWEKTQARSTRCLIVGCYEESARQAAGAGAHWQSALYRGRAAMTRCGVEGTVRTRQPTAGALLNGLWAVTTCCCVALTAGRSDSKSFSSGQVRIGVLSVVAVAVAEYPSRHRGEGHACWSYAHAVSRTPRLTPSGRGCVAHRTVKRLSGECHRVSSGPAASQVPRWQVAGGLC